MKYLLLATAALSVLSVYAAADEGECSAKRLRVNSSFSLYDRGLSFEEQGNYKEALTCFIQASKNGDAEVVTKLCDISYLDPRHYLIFYTQEENNYQENLAWLKKAAAQGSIVANQKLAKKYFEKSKYGKAYSHLEKLADLGDEIALENKTQLFDKLQADADEGNIAAKCELIKIGAYQGHARAEHSLARLYDGEKNFAKAVKWYRAAAEKGLAQSQFNLGVSYDNGEGVEQDKVEAAKWYLAAAQQGVLDAQYNLAWMYYDGTGVEKDLNEALFWFKEVATKGDKSALYEAGKIYNDRGDYTSAFEFYLAAAQLGLEDAQFGVATMYDNGEGVEQNDLEAFKWYKDAAEQGHRDAKYNLAMMYEDGQGIDQNYAEAFKLYKELAEKGDAGAIYQIGEMYKKGLGVKRNLSLAFDCFSLAQEKGHTEAKDSIEEVIEQAISDRFKEGIDLVHLEGHCSLNRAIRVVLDL